MEIDGEFIRMKVLDPGGAWRAVVEVDDLDIDETLAPVATEEAAEALVDVPRRSAVKLNVSARKVPSNYFNDEFQGNGYRLAIETAKVDGT